MITAIILVVLGIIAILAVVSQPKIVHYPKQDSNATEVPYGESKKKYNNPYSVYTDDPNAPED